MWIELKVIQQLKMTQTYNRILFYLQRIPVIGKKIPNRFYNAADFKTAISVIGAIAFVFFQFLTKALYFGILFALSHASFFIDSGNQQDPRTILMTLLFFYSVFAGTIVKIKRIDPGDMFDILCIKQLNMEAKRYYHAQMLLEYGLFFISYSVMLGVTFYFMNLPIVHALSFTLLLLGLRLAAQVLYINIYQEEKETPEKIYNFIMLPTIAISFFIAPIYIGGAFEVPLPNFFHWNSMLIGLVSIGVTVPILKNTNKYSEIARTALTSERIEMTQTVVRDAQVLGVQLNEDDLTEENVVPVESASTGITYINEIFFARLGHLLKKRIRRTLIVLAVIFLVLIGIVLGANYIGVIELPLAEAEIMLTGPWHVIIIYVSSFAYVGEHFTKFCFYNMDRMMMKNNYYRKPEYLLEAIWIRFKIAIRYNMPIFLLISVGLTVLYFVAGGRSIPILLLALLSTLVMMVFFSVHFLFLYYLIQPYTENMENKSPIYAIATFATFYAPAILVQVTDALSSRIVLIIYGFIIVYLAVGLFAVTKLAPKRFKLR